MKKTTTKVVARIDPKYLTTEHDYYIHVTDDGEILWTRTPGHIGHPKPKNAGYDFMKDGTVIERIYGMTPAQAQRYLKKKFGRKDTGGIG